jgi:hypothetical protein
MCPDDGGPDTGYLTSPDRRSQRQRLAFGTAPGRVVRACLPRVVLRRESTGTVSVGRTLSDEQIWREIRLREHLQRNAPEKGIDIQHLRDATLIPSSLRCVRSGDRWFASYRQFTKYDEWANKALRYLVQGKHKALFSRLHELAATLDPRLAYSAEVSRRVLYVPIDLGLPIEQQLAALQPELQEAREYLYRFTSSGPTRDRMRTVWRDIYAFILRDVGGRTIAEIGEEIFPLEVKETRESKVTSILSRIRVAARSIGFPVRSKPRSSRIGPLP